jgi:thiamine biosynthesis lipoprotein
MRAGRLVAALAVVALAACHSAPEPYRVTLLVFGGEATLEIRGVPREQAASAAASVSERLQRYGRDWHAWEDGALVDINAALARGEAAPAPASIRDLVTRSQALSDRSGGFFDPAVGGLIRLWGFHTSEFPVATPAPSEAQIEAWLATRPHIREVRVEGETLVSSNPAVQLDFGAIAEGVAAEETARLLADHGVRDALLSLGGDLYALGRADGEPWRVGIRDPYGGVFARVDLVGPEALFSSGSYNKFREAPTGARWPHVLDPRIGRPVRGTSAVAVIHRDPVLADIAATALMVGGPARFAELVQRLGLHCALLLTEENEMMITAAMDARVQLLREPVRLGAPLGTPGACTR